MQNYYVASLFATLGKKKGGVFTSAPAKSWELATREVMKSVGKGLPNDLRVRLISSKEAKLLRRIQKSHSVIVSASTELQRLHESHEAVTTAPVKRATLKRPSRLVRRHKAKKLVTKKK